MKVIKALDSVEDMTCPIWYEGLDRNAYGKFYAAQMKTAWGRLHQSRFPLMDGEELLASAVRYDLCGCIDRRPVRICGIGSIVVEPAHHGQGHVRVLLEKQIEQATRHGADVALLFCRPDFEGGVPDGFHAIALTDLTLDVAQPPRKGAPMTMVRAGDERDLAAIAAMGQVRADACRFHLDRDMDLIQYAITKKRLLAGLGRAGGRQLHFFIAEEGTTAAAYVVVSVVRDSWTIEECGDRDPSGARVGALLQALIAREPVERRPVIRGWLPPHFLPPQVRVLSATLSTDVMMIRMLSAGAMGRPLAGSDVLFWRNDVF